MELVTALVTPFLDTETRKIDYQALEKLILIQFDAMVNKIVIMGSTGEGHSLDNDERIAIASFLSKLRDDFLSKQNCQRKIQIICGINTNITHIAINQVKQLENTGINGFMICTPYYNKPTTEGIYDYFSSIANSTYLPIMLYDIPGRTCTHLPFDVVKKLINSHKNILGLKESTNDIGRINDALFFLNNSACKVYCGDDESILSFGVHNATGIVSVISNIYPNEMIEICKAIEQKDFIKALNLFRQIQPEMRKIFYTTNPIGVKKYLSQKYDFVQNICRSPIVADNSF